MTSYSTHPGARSRVARRAVATAAALGAAVLFVAACKDTAQPDANNPSLEGVQENPSKVTVTTDNPAFEMERTSFVPGSASIATSMG